MLVNDMNIADANQSAERLMKSWINSGAKFGNLRTPDLLLRRLTMTEQQLAAEVGHRRE